MAEMIARFVLGGILVSVFAAIGEISSPKTFAGIFGAAPSVALATLSLAFVNQGTGFVRAECWAMTLGALGLVAYCSACALTLQSQRVPVWFGASICWIVWLATSLGLWWLV